MKMLGIRDQHTNTLHINQIINYYYVGQINYYYVIVYTFDDIFCTCKEKNIPKNI